jgi:hypothetical protein
VPVKLLPLFVFVAVHVIVPSRFCTHSPETTVLLPGETAKAGRALAAIMAAVSAVAVRTEMLRLN